MRRVPVSRFIFLLLSAHIQKMQADPTYSSTCISELRLRESKEGGTYKRVLPMKFKDKPLILLPFWVVAGP